MPIPNSTCPNCGSNDVTTSLELGVIGNCQVSALIDRSGRYVWACLPRLDGDPVFCALLRKDEEEDAHGFFATDLAGAVSSEQSYERNTAILITTVTAED